MFRCIRVALLASLTALVLAVASPASADSIERSAAPEPIRVSPQVVTSYEGPVPAKDSEGTPAEKCRPSIDGKEVWTYNGNETKSYWICFYSDPWFEDGKWVWNEVVPG